MIGNYIINTSKKFLQPFSARLFSSLVFKNQSSSSSDSVTSNIGKWLALGIGMSLWGVYENAKKAEYCGIVGAIGVDNAQDVLFEGLLVLQSRGYDSVGLATLSPENDLVVSKYASLETTSECFSKLRGSLKDHKNSTIGIGSKK